MFFFDTRLLKIGPELLLAALYLCCCWGVARRDAADVPRGVCAALAGCLLGLLVASQIGSLPQGAVFLVALGLGARGRVGTLTWRAVAAAVAFAAVCLATQGLVRTLAGEHDLFIPQGGIHARLGFHDGATGTYAALPDLPSLPYGHCFGGRLLAERESGRAMRFDEADEHHWQAAWDWVRDHPNRALLALLSKLQFFFSNHEFMGNYYLPAVEAHSAMLRYLPTTWGLLGVLSVWGALSLWTAGKRRLLVFLLIALAMAALPSLVTFVTSRYRLPAAVPLCVLAGSGAWAFLCLLRDALTTRSRALLLRLACWTLPAVLMGAFAALPVPAKVLRDMRQTAAGNTQRSIQASRMHRGRLRAAGAGRYAADSQWDLALRAWRLHRHEESYRLLRSDGPIPSDRAELQSLALAYDAWLGQREQARARLERLTARQRDAALALMGNLERAWCERLAEDLEPDR